MAEEVEISNVGGENGVASEVTLRKLIRTMEKMAKASGKDSNSQESKTQEAYNKAQSQGVKVTTKHTDALDDNTSAVKRSTRALGSMFGTAFSAAVQGISALGGSVTGLSKEFLIGGDRLSDFAQHLPLVGGHLSMLTQVLDGAIDRFRAFSDVGVTFGNDIKEMMGVLATTGISARVMEDALIGNADVLKMLGSTVNEGSKRFIQLNKEMGDSGLRGNLLGMGLTVEGVVEGLASYTRNQARLGRLDNLNNQQLIAGSISYIKELDKLTKITGMSRKEAEDALAAQQADAMVRSIRAEIEARNGNVAQFDANTARLEQISQAGGGAAVTALKGLADGIANNPLEAALVNMTDGLALETMKAYRAGNLSQEEFNARLKEMGPMMANFMSSPEAIGGLRQLGHPIADLQDSAAAFLSITDASGKAAEDEQNKRDATTNALAQFEDIINRLREKVLTPFVDFLLPKINSFMEGTFTDANINSFITNFGNFVDEFAADPQKKIGEIYENIKDYILGEMDETGGRSGGVFAGLGTVLSDAFTAIFENETLRKAVSDGFTSLMDLMSRTFANSFLARTILGIDREEVAANILKDKESDTTTDTTTDTTIPVDADGDTDTTSSTPSGPSDETGLTDRLDTKGVLSQNDAETVAAAAFEGIQDRFNSAYLSKDVYNTLLDDLGPEMAKAFKDQMASNQSFMDRARPERLEAGVEIKQLAELAEDGEATPQQLRLIEAIGRSLMAQNILNAQPVEGIPQYNSGTGGFADFGTGTLAELHGSEAVIPENSPAGDFLKNAGTMQKQLTELTSNKNSAILSQEGVINAINQLNSTMSNATAVLMQIEKTSKKQVSKLGAVGSVY